MRPAIPRLIGVIHLPALPGSPRFEGDLAKIVAAAADEAKLLATAGYDGVMIENFGDAPFYPEHVPAITVASMTACAIACRKAAPNVALGINVLRNDAESALSIAVASAANLVRINVHIGARVTDQGIIQGKAHETLRLRRQLGAERVMLFCDVDVKHSAPLGARPIADEAHDIEGRGLADALLVTGSGTGRGADAGDLDAVLAAASVPVLVASGVTDATLAASAQAYGVVVGSALRRSGRAGEPVDEGRARAFAAAFRGQLA